MYVSEVRGRKGAGVQGGAEASCATVRSDDLWARTGRRRKDRMEIASTGTVRQPAPGGGRPLHSCTRSLAPCIVAAPLADHATLSCCTSPVLSSIRCAADFCSHGRRLPKVTEPVIARVWYCTAAIVWVNGAEGVVLCGNVLWTRNRHGRRSGGTPSRGAQTEMIAMGDAYDALWGFSTRRITATSAAHVTWMQLRRAMCRRCIDVTSSGGWCVEAARVATMPTELLGCVTFINCICVIDRLRHHLSRSCSPVP
jgi:hypothetical protein